MIRLVFFFGVVAKIVSGEYHKIMVNYDIGSYKLLHINETLELTCKNLLNRNPPSWTYHSRLYRDPRMKLSQDVGESRLVISNARAEDAGQYRCSIDQEYNLKTFHYNKTIEVIVNEIREVKSEEEKDSIKLLCDVHAYPSATVIWKIVYVNKTLNPQPEDPGEDEYWIPADEKVVVDKSEGRWTLRPYKGVNNAELIIANVTEIDNGNYTCVARNLAGERSKDFTVRVTREAAVIYTATSGNSKAFEPETENSQEVEGLGGGTIALLVLSSFVIFGSVVGAVIITLRRMQLQKTMGKIIELSVEYCSASSSLTYTKHNDASTLSKA